jgi:GlcNAc-P-P-Und epimerase
VIYTSSMYVCKPGFIPADFDTYKPHTADGESKVKGELLVKEVKDSKYQWVIIRPTSIWGPWFNIPYIDFFNVVYQGKYFDFGRACSKTYGYIGNAVFQIRKLIEVENVHGKTFYIGDAPAIQISEWANEISLEMKKGSIRKVPFFLLKSAAILGDILAALKIKFPINSFRLNNMQTDNILPLTELYEIAGPGPYTRIDGVKETINWLVDFKGYKI